MTDAVEALRLITRADVPHLDAHAEVRLELADERAKVDALFGREVEGEAPPVELPLGVRDLHLEIQGAGPLHGNAPRLLLFHAMGLGAGNVVARRQADGGAQRPALLLAVGGAGLALFG